MNEATQVLIEEHPGGVLELRLAGARRRNALGRATIEQLESVVAAPREGTNVLLISAEGPDFCAGYDLREAASGGADRLIAQGENFAALRTSELPVVAALQGKVIGGGLELALAADVRIAAWNATLSVPAGALGLVYSQEGVRLLVEVLGESRVRAMLLAGRSVSAVEARAAGAVCQVVRPQRLRARALEVAASIASWPGVASRGNRKVLDLVAGRMEVSAEQLRLESLAPGGAFAQNLEHFALAIRQRGGMSSTDGKHAGARKNATFRSLWLVAELPHRLRARARWSPSSGEPGDPAACTS